MYLTNPRAADLMYYLFCLLLYLRILSDPILVHFLFLTMTYGVLTVTERKARKALRRKEEEKVLLLRRRDS